MGCAFFSMSQGSVAVLSICSLPLELCFVRLPQNSAWHPLGLAPGELWALPGRELVR